MWSYIEDKRLKVADPGLNVGGGLLPIAVCQLAHLFLADRYREQAPSHI
ncbi:hypothetical protein C4K01_2592 [Pseudomonas synxantha]|nr:hypothetical protein C4K01_2592 [Pseudomonas synxantha]